MNYNSSELVMTFNPYVIKINEIISSSDLKDNNLFDEI